MWDQEKNPQAANSLQMLQKSQVHCNPQGRYMGIYHRSKQGIYTKSLDIASSESTGKTVVPNPMGWKWWDTLCALLQWD